MKRIISYLSVILFFAVSCVPTFEEVGELPDNPGIKQILVGNAGGKIPQENAIYPNANLDTVWVKDKSVDFSNVYLNANLQPGCTVEPLEGSVPFGQYGDFSTPQKYRVTAPTGNSADWTVVLDYYIPPVGCLADRWVGSVVCEDLIYPSYSPTTCVGEKLNNDCSQLKLTFDFWADGTAVVELEFQLGDIDIDTFTGPLTLVNDVNFTSYGDDLTFHSGLAGTYNAIANELYLTLEFSGYDIGGGPYEFTVKQGS